MPFRYRMKIKISFKSQNLEHGMYLNSNKKTVVEKGFVN